MLVFLLLLLFTAVNGALVLPNFFTNDMVLQRNGAIIWGRATDCGVGQTIIVRLKRQSNGEQIAGGSGVVGTDNRWKIELNTPEEPTTDQFTLEVSGCNDLKTLNGILVGEMLLVGGQSNINAPSPINQYMTTTEKNRLYAEISQFQNIRWYTMDRNVENDYSQNKFNLASHTPNKKWELHAKENYNNESPAATGLLTARWIIHFFRELKNVDIPVGFMDIGRGGSKISDYLLYSHQDDTTCGGTNLPYNKYPECFDTQHTARCNVHWWNILQPIKHMKFSALVWWQGEREVRFDGITISPNIPAETYACVFGIFADKLRDLLGYQIPIFSAILGSESSKRLVNTDVHKWRNQQQKAVTAVNNAWYVVTHDKSQKADTHANLRYETARRWALQYMKRIHEVDISEPEGPRMTGEFKSVTYNGKNYLRVLMDVDTSYRLSMEQTNDCNLDTGLFEDCCITGTPFQIKKPSGEWVDIPTNKIILDVGSVYLQTDEPLVIGVSYHYRNYVLCQLYNDYQCTTGKIPGPTQLFETIMVTPGTILPGQTSHGRDTCPQVGFPTASPTKSPTLTAPTPTPPPTPKPTSSPTTLPTLPPGVVLYKKLDDYGTNCQHPNVRKNSHQAVTQAALGGNHYLFGLDRDGAYNTISTTGNPNDVSQWNFNNNQNQGFPDNNLNTISIGSSLPNENDCSDRCNDAPNCVGIVWQNGDCYLLSGCAKINDNSGSVSKMRTSFPSGFIAADVEVGTQCTNSEVGPVPITSTPVNPGDCFNRCRPLYATHFTIDHDLQCHCFESCTKSEVGWSTTYSLRSGDIITRAPTPSPSKSPTFPAPTTSPTSTPTYGPTKSPTRRPTGSPTTLRPTQSPTVSPTPNPTYGGIEGVVQDISESVETQGGIFGGLLVFFIGVNVVIYRRYNNI